MEQMIPTCINGGCERPVIYSHTHKNGTKRWRPVCGRCHQASYGAKPLDPGVTATKLTHCENEDGRYGYRCTAHIPYPGSLEMDHIDGDRCNNVPENIQTLCKVCHSYKSHLNNDFKKNKKNSERSNTTFLSKNTQYNTSGSVYANIPDPLALYRLPEEKIIHNLCYTKYYINKRRKR
jgi:hypothetical protein